MFSMTLTAANEVLAAAARSDAAGMALRVAARQIADGSLEYGFGFDEQREEDEVVQVGRLKVVVGAHSLPLLADTRLDFVEIAPEQFEFVFLPPSVAMTGGSCGSGAPQSGGACGNGGCGSGGCGA